MLAARVNLSLWVERGRTWGVTCWTTEHVTEIPLPLLTGERVFSTNNADICLDDLNTSLTHDRNAPDLEPLTLPTSTAPGDFINEVNVTKLFQSPKSKLSSGPEGLSNLPLKYAAKELSAVFTDLFQLSIKTGVLQEKHHCQKSHLRPPLQKCARLHAVQCP